MDDLLEQLRRFGNGSMGDISSACRQAISAIEQMREALKPFAQTGWMTSDTEHTGRTVVAHMHPESEREIILSSDDFRRAAAALTAGKLGTP